MKQTNETNKQTSIIYMELWGNYIKLTHHDHNKTKSWVFFVGLYWQINNSSAGMFREK